MGTLLFPTLQSYSFFDISIYPHIFSPFLIPTVHTRRGILLYVQCYNKTEHGVLHMSTCSADDESAELDGVLTSLPTSSSPSWQQPR